IDATGGVLVTQKDQNATGDAGIFDTRANTVTLSGNVVVTRGKDIMRGQRLVVDLTTGVSHMESGGGRVEGLFQSAPRSDANSQGAASPGSPSQGSASQDAPGAKPPASASPGLPLRLN